MRVQCSQCGKSYRVNASAIGKKVKCRCGHSFTAGLSSVSSSTEEPGSLPPLPRSKKEQESNGPAIPPIKQNPPTVAPKNKTDSAKANPESPQIDIDVRPEIKTAPNVDSVTVSPSPSDRRSGAKKSLHPLLLGGGIFAAIILVAVLIVALGSGNGDQKEQASNKTSKSKQTNQTKEPIEKLNGTKKPINENDLSKKVGENSKQETIDQKQTKLGNRKQKRKDKNKLEASVSSVFAPDLTVEIELPEWDVPVGLPPKEAIEKYGSSSYKDKQKFEEVLIRAGADSVPVIVAQIRATDSRSAARFGIYPLCSILSKIGEPAIDGLLEIAKDESLERDTRKNALRSIGDMGPLASSATNDIVKIFHSQKKAGIQGLKISALGALGGIGLMTSDVEEIYNDVLVNKGEKYNSSYISVALKGAKNMGSDAAKLVPTIRPYLLKKTQHARDAAETLGAIGSEAGAAAAEFNVLIKNNDDLVSYRTFHALRDIGESAKSTVPALIKRLKESENDYERADIAEALGQMGSHASEALNTLEDYLKEAEQKEFDQAQRIVYRVAIDRIWSTPSASIPYLQKALTDNKHNARTEAVKQIGRLGAKANSLIPDLSDIILNVDTKHSVVYLAIMSIGQMGEDGADGLGTLIQFINREQQNPKGQKTYRMHAINAIAAINSDPRVVRGLQRIASNDPNSRSREQAYRLLQKIEAEKNR